MSVHLIQRFFTNTQRPSRIAIAPHKPRTRTSCRTKNLDSTELALLDKFWKSKGIQAAQDRQDRIQIAQEHRNAEPISQHEILPGVFHLWKKHKRGNQIGRVSQSVLDLSGVLGGSEDVDMVWMCLREPEMSKTDRTLLIQRLLEMKLSLSGLKNNVLKMVQHQPKHLFEYEKTMDLLIEPSECIPACAYGLMSDTDTFDA